MYLHVVGDSDAGLRDGNKLPMGIFVGVAVDYVRIDLHLGIWHVQRPGRRKPLQQAATKWKKAGNLESHCWISNHST